MGGNRKHGYARGNRSGRNSTTYPPPWYCIGCERTHGSKVFRNVIHGENYCDRKADQLIRVRSQRRMDAFVAFSPLP